MTLPRRSLLERFMEKVSPEPNTGCWLWTGAVLEARGGYGALGRPHGGGHLRAHRVAWLLFRGPIPAGLHVCHHCDNPPCVSPDHLFLGTRQDNMDDMRRKGRGFVPTPPVRRGSETNLARLNETQVAEMRARAAAGERVDILAAEFAVAPETVYRALSGKTWAHVGPPCVLPPRPISPPKPCLRCGRDFKPLRHGLCDRCRHRARRLGSEVRQGGAVILPK